MKSESQSQGRLPLRKNFAWAFVANVIHGAGQWGMLVLLTKMATTVDVGRFALGLAVCTPLFTFANMHLRELQATDALREYRFSDYLGLRVISSSGALVTLAILISFMHYSRVTVLAVLAIGICKYFECISDLVYGFFQQCERMDRIAVSLMSRGVLGILCFAVGFLLTRDVLGALAGLAVATATVVFLYDLRLGFRSPVQNPDSQLGLRNSSLQQTGGELKADATRMKKLAWFASPLGIVMLLISLQANIPRYFVEYYLGQSALGVFAAMAYFMLAGTTLAAALGQAASPRMSQFFASGNPKEFMALFLKQMVIAVALGIGGVLVAITAGEPLLAYIYRPEYAKHKEVFVVLMVTAGLSYVVTFLGHAIMATRKFSPLLPLYVSVTVCTGASCWWLVPTKGLLGAALGMLFGVSVQILGSVWLLSTTLRKAKPELSILMQSAETEDLVSRSS